MSGIREKLEKYLIQAAKSKDSLRLTTLRMLKSAIKNKEIDLRPAKDALDDNGIITLITSMIKQRNDSIEMFKKRNRVDLVEKEEAEIKILQEFLPTQLSKEEVKAKVEEVIKKVGASGMQDLGKVMKEIMPLVSGRVSGKDLSTIVKELLTAI